MIVVLSSGLLEAVLEKCWMCAQKPTLGLRIVKSMPGSDAERMRRVRPASLWQNTCDISTPVRRADIWERMSIRHVSTGHGG